MELALVEDASVQLVEAGGAAARRHQARLWSLEGSVR
jgi:hypothetical protein